MRPMFRSSSFSTFFARAKAFLPGTLLICMTLTAGDLFAQSLTAVQSRKLHPIPAATFDLPIDTTAAIGGAVTFESRAIGAGHSIVFQFDIAITQAGTAASIDDTAAPIGAANAAINPANSNEVIVTLTGIPDNKRVTVSLDGVNGNANHFAVSVGFRVGDSDNTGTLTLADVTRMKARSGQTVNAANFTYDINTSGLVSAADLAALKKRSRLFNAAPNVNAGTAQIITLPATAALNGTASDDGLPEPPTLSTTWSRLSGPSNVTFGNAAALSTTATFAGPGNYVLRLTASDGQLSSTSDVSITVNPGPAATLAVSGFASPVTSGTAGNLTVTLRDASGFIATGYRGTVHFTSSDGTATLPANYTFTAGDNGVHVFNATLATIGTQSITATDTVMAALTGSQTNISVTSAVLPGLFEKATPWNKDVSGMLPSSRSAAIISTLGNSVAAGGLGGWGNGNKLQIDFSIPIFAANAATPRRTIIAPAGGYCYGGPDCDPVPLQMPVPANGNIEGSTNFVCDTANEDCHMLVVETSEKKLYEIYNATASGANIEALGAFVWDLTKLYPDVLRGDQCTSADAAGLPMAALIPTADEVAAGDVPHAIRFILPNPRMKKGAFPHGVFVRPAVHAGGPSNTTHPDAPPYGVRLRLKANFDESTFTPGAKVILHAMKKYGMILSDGGNIALTFADDRLTTAKWAGVGITAQTFNNIPVSQFDVVDLGPEIENTFDCVRVP